MWPEPTFANYSLIVQKQVLVIDNLGEKRQSFLKFWGARAERG